MTRETLTVLLKIYKIIITNLFLATQKRNLTDLDQISFGSQIYIYKQISTWLLKNVENKCFGTHTRPPNNVMTQKSWVAISLH